MNAIAKIKEYKLSEVVASKGIELTPNGRDKYKCLCPFHNDSNPSLIVDDRSGRFKCWSCGAKGDSIKFEEQYEQVETREAVGSLCKHFDIEFENTEQDERTPIYKALSNAMRIYRSSYSYKTTGNAREYMQSRKISEEVCELFDVGFAKSGKHLSGLVKDTDDYVSAKLVHADNGNVYDTFRNRVVFPIKNQHGSVISFGGRTLGDDKAKYINGYDSDVYKKSNVLFGLYECLQANKGKRLEHICVVEGYIDVLAGFEMGYSNVVSCCGTNLTSEQITLLFKYTDEIVIIMDGDKAGNEGLEKGIINALPCIDLDKTVRYLVMDEGDDLANMLEQGRQNSFATKLELTFGFEDWMVSKLRSIKSRNKFKQMCLQRKQVEDWFAKMECEHLTDVLKTYLRSEMSKRNG